MEWQGGHGLLANNLAGPRVARAACLGATASAPGGREVGRSGVGSMVND